MTDNPKDLARQAKKKAGNFALSDFCQYILDSIRTQQKFIELANESHVRVMAMDFEKIYADYAASINQPALTVDEKRQAILEHILNNNKDELE